MYLTSKGREKIWYALQGSGVKHNPAVAGMPVARAVLQLVEQGVMTDMARLYDQASLRR